MQDNYLLQARQAKARFLTYSQEEIIKRHGLKADDTYLYLTFFSLPYRISRKTGDLFRFAEGRWEAADSHGEVMTVLDLLCDSREDRHPAGTYRNMQDFGHQFHRSLGEENPDARYFDSCPEKLKKACPALGGVPFPQGDIAFRIPVFEDLSLVLQFWQGDEEFAPRLRYLWDSNALMYLKYETMYFAADVLVSRIRQF